MADIESIPAPRALPLVGNLHQIPKAGLIGHLLQVSKDFVDPGIFKLRFGARVGLFVTHPDLVAELCDETRFRKIPGPGLRVVRKFAGDGLFTAFSDEANWGKAHRILLPAFAQRAMRGYFDLILEVCDQLIAKWSARAGGELLVADDFTRLTLDSIAIAGFGHRFDSFAHDELDPFLESLASALGESLNVITRLPIQQRFAKRSTAQFDADIVEMNALVDGIIAERRANPREAKDLLNLMITAVDPETGEGLDDLNIRYQVLTFLIAGHETTSGLLTFAFMEMLKDPAVLAQAYAEVDRVLPGDTRPQYEHLAHLKVIERIVKETQRLWPTAPAFSVGPWEDTVIGGKWRLRKDRPVNVYAPGLQRHPAAWSDPEDFDIDRWLPEAEAAHHPHAYKPFGNGARACIGRQFALVEAKLAIALILQKFQVAERRGYRLTLKETLSIKPDDFWVRVKLRQPHERLSIGEAVKVGGNSEVASAAGAGQRLSVLYGTSLGTARDIAEEIAERAANDGFETRVVSIDESMGTLPEDRVIVLVTATYNGRAPDSALAAEAAIDAGQFADARWPETKFAVLGIGNSQWPNYQAFPKKIDAAFEATGAQRLCPRGEANGDGDFDGGVTAFLKDLWAALGAKGEAAKASGLTLHIVDTKDARAAVLPEQAVALTITRNDEMILPAEGLWDFAKEAPRGSTRFLTVKLPEGQSYAAGDHLAIYARNRKEHVDLAIERLGVPGAMQVVPGGSSGRFRHLPIGRTVTVRQLLTDFVELQEPMPRRALDTAIAATRCPDARGKLEALRDDATWQAEVADKRLTLLGMMIQHPAIEIDLQNFVELSAAIAPRFYSIASSPLVEPNAVDLIVGTVSAPAWSGIGTHQGFASTHMRDLGPGDDVFGYLRRPNPPFAPPQDTAVPLILIGPGTGFAPLRGFIQERAALGKGALIHLFFGARHPDHDWLCRDEMDTWAADGVIDLHLAWSALDGHPHRFVQDAIWDARAAVWDAIGKGGQVFLCGDGRFMAPAVRDTLIRIHADKTGGGHDEGSAWLEGLIEDGIYHQDVFGFGK
ncbi:Bifunctional cytochrome P450/NADPH--P450 reductase [Sphingomonas antarctica]|uniref:cytochrome P450 n=1 Tax=Sphingomonas antarctica TaxID=2040274 RepID=UPI0039E77F12